MAGRIASYLNRMLSDAGDLSMSKAAALYAVFTSFLCIWWFMILATIAVLGSKDHALPPAAEVTAWASVIGEMVKLGLGIYTGGKALGIGGSALMKWLASRNGGQPPKEGGDTVES